MAYVKCNDELHRRLKAYAAERGGTMQDLVESWVERGMGAAMPSELEALTPSGRALVLKVIRVLREEKNSQLFADVAKILRGTLGLVKDS